MHIISFCESVDVLDELILFCFIIFQRFIAKLGMGKIKLIKEGFIANLGMGKIKLIKERFLAKLRMGKKSY